MKKLLMLLPVIMMASVFVFAADEGGQAPAPRTKKECVKQCKDEAKGCINVAEDNKAQIRECRKKQTSCIKGCRQECMKQCKESFSGCMNAAEADKAQARKCRKDNNACTRKCR